LITERYRCAGNVSACGCPWCGGIPAHPFDVLVFAYPQKKRPSLEHHPSYNLRDLDILTDIKNLDGLSDLKHIKFLYIYGSPKLSNIDGLKNTEAIFNFALDGDTVLSTLTGIGHLSRLGSLAIKDNLSITHLADFSRLKVAGSFYFERTILENLDGL